MDENRIILVDMVRQMRGPAGILPDGYDVDALSNEELAAIVVSNALGIPMIFPLS